MKRRVNLSRLEATQGAGRACTGSAKKMARWWDRLGGRPVDHAASPRLILSCKKQQKCQKHRKAKDKLQRKDVKSFSEKLQTGKLLLHVPTHQLLLLYSSGVLIASKFSTFLPKSPVFNFAYFKDTNSS